MKFVSRAVGAFVLAWLGFLALVYSKMTASPEEFGMFMSHMPMPAYSVLPFETLWSRARAGTVNVGDAAPDFTLASVKSGEPKDRLSELRGSKPVVLVFGSYT